MLIMRCTINLQSPSCIDFTNAYYQGYITSGEQVLLKMTIDVNIYGGKCEFVLKIN